MLLRLVLITLCVIFPYTQRVHSSTESDNPSAMPTNHPTNGGCIDHTKDKGHILIGELTTVCLFLGTVHDNLLNDSPTLQMKYFTPEVDQYSRYRIRGSYTDWIEQKVMDNQTESISIHMASHEMLSSTVKMWYDAQSDLLFPHLTAIIEVQDGEVQNIVWDNASTFCNKPCTPNTYDYTGALLSSQSHPCGCYIPREQCQATDCDLTVYTVWTGTDENGKGLMSFHSRFNAFEPRQLKDRLEDTWEELSLGI